VSPKCCSAAHNERPERRSASLLVSVQIGASALAGHVGGSEQIDRSGVPGVSHELCIGVI
jgi:hypothetical protein